MLTKQQLDSIEEYLLLYKMPLDLLVEVQDHMANQILDVQDSAGLDFDSAFREVKIAWESELKPTRFRFFYEEEVPTIVKRLIKLKYWSLLKKALLYAGLGLGVVILSPLIFKSMDQYAIFFRLYHLLFLIVPFLIWLTHKDIRNALKENTKYKGRTLYTVYQYNVRIMLSNTILLTQFIQNDGSALYLFITESLAGTWWTLLIAMVSFVVQLLVIFSCLTVFEHKRSMGKMKVILQK